MRALAVLLAVTLAVSLGLSACGRKNPPKPPMSYVPKDDAGQPDEAESTQDGFKDYRPIRNHAIGNQP